MAPARLLLALSALAAALVPGAAPARAQASEEAVKAAFIPKFVRYVEMPADAQPLPGQPFYLCVVGRDPFGPLIDRAAARETIDGRPVAVRRFADASSPAVAGCHVAFVAGRDGGQTGQMLAAMGQHRALTVTDARAGSARGMIHFVVSGGRVRFHIDNGAAAARGIAISSRLLALALDVKQAPQ